MVLISDNLILMPFKSHRISTVVTVCIFALLTLAIPGCSSAPLNSISSPAEHSSSDSEATETGATEDETDAVNKEDTETDTEEEAEEQAEEVQEREAPTPDVTPSDKTWTVAIQENEAFSEASGWEVRWRKLGETSWTEWAAQAFEPEDAASLSHIETGLENGVTYEIEVRLLFEDDTVSPTHQTTVKPFTTPGAVENLASESANERLSITFNAPQNDGGATVTGYRYRYRTQEDATWTAWESTTATSINLENLTNRETYDVEVVAVNEAGDGPGLLSSGTPDWARIQINPPEQAYDGFGWDLGVSGNHLIVTGNPGTGNNHATFYERRNGAYHELSSLQSELIGQAVAVSGNTAALEIYKQPWEQNLERGRERVRIFHYTNGSWVVDTDIALGWGDLFRGPGAHALDLDESRLAVSTFIPDVDTGTNAYGVAQVFQREASGGWTSLGSPISDPASDVRTHFGWHVAISGDTLAVSAPGSFESGSRTRNGFVSLYEWNATSGSWQRQQTLSNNASDGFGTGLHLSSERLVIGAPEGGKVFVYEQSNSGQWNLSTTIVAPSGQSFGFGRSVSSDGNLIAVGRVSANAKGHAFLYEETGSGWELAGEIVNDLVSNKAQAGEPVALQGNRLHVAAVTQPNGSGNPRGRVFVFDDVSNRYQAP